MSSDSTALAEARNAHQSGSWRECIAACERAIAEVGAAPSDDWIAARLTLGSAVSCGKVPDFVEAAIGRVQEVLTALGRDDDPRTGPARRVLGYLYEIREVGAKSTNLTLAIDEFEQALSHFAAQEDKTSWAHLKVAIALDLRERLAVWAEEGITVHDDEDYQYRRSSVERGLHALRDALEAFHESEYSEERTEVTAIIVSFEDLLAKLPADERAQGRGRP